MKWGTIITLLLAAVLWVDASGAIAVVEHYITGKTQEDLSFSFKSCNKSGNTIKPAIFSKTWQGEKLVITGIAFPNCTSTWLLGSYELVGNNVLLRYSPVTPKKLAAACDCPTDVRYEISGLKKEDYDVSISEGPDVEYSSLLYKLLAR